MFDGFRDFLVEITPYVAVKFDHKQGNLDELKTSMLEPAMKKYLPYYVTILEDSKSGKPFL